MILALQFDELSEKEIDDVADEVLSFLIHELNIVPTAYEIS